MNIITELDSCPASHSDPAADLIASDEVWTPNVPSMSIEASPYENTWRWIASHPHSADAVRLARLLLCLSRTQWWEYSVFYECTGQMDDRSLEVAVLVFRYYLEVGPNAEFKSITHKALSMFPSLSKTNRWRRVSVH